MPEISFASLSPSLLARKGGAKPAMRPQHAALATMPNSISGSAEVEDHEKLEDLGWNDMGGDHNDAPQGADVVQLTPMPRAVEPGLEPVLAVEPEVLRQREEIAERIAPAPASLHAIPRPNPARVRKDRAAFTLRLDPVRHVKLRLACTMRDTSAQALVTEALDALLAGMPELETLAAQVKRR